MWHVGCSYKHPALLLKSSTDTTAWLTPLPLVISDASCHTAPLESEQLCVVLLKQHFVALNESCKKPEAGETSAHLPEQAKAGIIFLKEKRIKNPNNLTCT